MIGLRLFSPFAWQWLSLGCSNFFRIVINSDGTELYRLRCLSDSRSGGDRAAMGYLSLLALFGHPTYVPFWTGLDCRYV